MKGPLIHAATALVLVPSLVQAQSNVTVYGRLDVGLTKENNGTTRIEGGLNTSDKLQVRESSGNRLGFRGSEDLGGGWKAIFQIEHRFTADTGLNNGSQPGARLCQSTTTGQIVAEQTADANGNFTTACPTGSTARNTDTRERVWAGMSWVGLSGPAGTLKLGRDYTPSFRVGVKADPFGYNNMARMGSGPTIPGSPVRFPNMVSYDTPKLGGFSALAAYVPKEVSTAGAKDGFGANAVYAAGPVYFGVAYERPVRLAATSATDPDVNFWIATGAWKIGPAEIIGTFTKGESDPGTTTAAKSDRRHIGLGFTFDVGVGQILAMGSRFLNETTATATAAANEATTTKIGLGYFHFLSKRTTIFIDAAQAKTSNTAVADLTTRRGYEAGVRHNF